MRVALLALVLVAWFAGVAQAYPQFQFATGTERCQACHFGPDGGGLVNAFGRDEVGDTISWGGDGRFLHGAWTPPDAVQLGGDFRMAGLGLARETDEPRLTAFPMQADLYARVGTGAFSVNVTGGLNGAARSRPDGAGVETYLVSREHYAMYQREVGSLYIRAGRFYPVIGLRMHDHTALVRRGLGYYNLDEPYGIGGGTTGDDYEVHVSAFAPNPLPSTAAGAAAYGATAYYERFLGDASIAGQARYAQSDDSKRILVGAVGKYWLSKAGVLLLGELDLQRQMITDSATSRLQLVGYAGATKMFLPGLMLGAAAQRWDPDTMLRGSARSTVQLDAQLFPWAHFEVHLLARAGFIGGRGASPDSLAMLQLHYFL
jgi:hypothetical protein